MARSYSKGKARGRQKSQRIKGKARGRQKSQRMYYVGGYQA